MHNSDSFSVLKHYARWCKYVWNHLNALVLMGNSQLNDTILLNSSFSYDVKDNPFIVFLIILFSRFSGSSTFTCCQKIWRHFASWFHRIQDWGIAEKRCTAGGIYSLNFSNASSLHISANALAIRAPFR